MAREKTSTRSFRISDSGLLALQEEANRKGVSVNTLLNQLLLSYSRYDRFIKRAGLVKLTSSTFRRIVEAGTEESLSGAGRKAGGSITKAIITARAGRVNAASVIDFLRDTGDYSDLYEFSEFKRDGDLVITLTHPYGKKGSVFLQGYIEALLGLVDAHPRFMTGDDSVSFEL